VNCEPNSQTGQKILQGSMLPLYAGVFGWAALRAGARNPPPISNCMNDAELNFAAYSKALMAL
jgi:hypothetical protein